MTYIEEEVLAHIKLVDEGKPCKLQRGRIASDLHLKLPS